jgi:manganese peroxidase
MPPPFGTGSDQESIRAQFQSKGFSDLDLAALLGAHTVSRANRQQNASIPTDGPQDSTPGRWDTKYYTETYNPPDGVFPLDSDRNCAEQGTPVGDQFSQFQNAKSQWDAAFADAAFRLSLVGVSQAETAGLIDCTSFLPSGTSAKMIRSAPVNARVR